MSRSRGLVAAGVAAGLLANAWALETLVAQRARPAASWISDLGARSESTAWLFDLLDAASGVALCLVAVGVLRRLGPVSPALRRGAIALLVAGVGTILDGALPMSCAEALGGGCRRDVGVLDVLHGVESMATIAATLAAFALLGAGLRREPGLRALATTTIAAGIAWTALTVLTGLTFVVDGLDADKGTFQRAGQVVLGLWLVILAVRTARLRPARR